MAIFNLATLTSNQGTIVFGAEANNDYSGRSVSGAGDVNGDGFDDLLIGAHGGDASNNVKQNAGESYVVFGGVNLLGTIDLANLGADGIIIYGADSNDRSGYAVSAAGDVNGDGFDDLLIGARLANAAGNNKPDAGESYVIFGGAALPSTIDLANLGTLGVTIYGVDPNDTSGGFVRGAGDVNGDGFDDLIIGAPAADSAGNNRLAAGESYVIFGRAVLPPTIDLANLGSNGVTLFGADDGDRSGFWVSGAGDVNGDGFDDFIIGALSADAVNNLTLSAGESYLIFGDDALPESIDLANLGAAGITIYGVDAYDQSGGAVTGAGDVNGDGFDDLLIGAFYADSSNNNTLSAGENYVIFGDATLPSTIHLTNLNSAGIRLLGVDADDRSGRAVSSAGDVNADGFDDLLIGAPLADASNNTKASAGESYVIFGGATLPSVIDLATLGTAGNRYLGAEADDRNGRMVSGVGDVNGDGFDDVILGSYRADAFQNLKSTAGESYVIFGADFLGTVSHMGTAAAETLTGTSGVNVMVGGVNNDTLVSNGGVDVLTGGQGDDTLVVSDLTFKRISGGNGNDVLRLNGAGLSLNLAIFRDNRIRGIETIDITGSGNNTLVLNQREVLNISDESNTLVVRRNTGDAVNIGTGWTQVANETNGPNAFLVFTQGQATLKLQVAGTASVINRRAFYNRSTSTVFGNGNGNPVNSIDSTKTALLPGQTTSFANYTSYSRGLNGIVVDVANVGGSISAADLQFATWDGINLAGFVATAAVPTISILPEGGSSSSTRVKIEFADNAIRNTWLRITVLANSNTGLANNDVFYFGHAIGDMNNGNIGNPITVRTNATDTSIVRQNQSIGMNSVGVTSIHDLDKDGRVNATDTSIVRQNQSASIIRFFDAPSSFLASDSTLAVDLSMADSSWLEGLNPFSNKRRAERFLK